MDNNGWVDETLALRVLHSMRNSMKRSQRREHGVSAMAEEPVLVQDNLLAGDTVLAQDSPAPAPVTPTEAAPAPELAPAYMINDHEVPEAHWASEAHRAPEAHIDSAAPIRRAASPRQRARRSLARAGLVASTVTAVIGGTAGVAFANAANPLPTSQGTATIDQATGKVTVNLTGTWDWGPSNVPKGPQDCAGRFGLGWAVDWWGMSASSSAASIPGLTNGSGVALNPGGSIPSGGQFFHVNTNTQSTVAGHATSYDGVDQFALACTPDAQGYASGSWAATAVYPNAASVPPQLCVITYDMHGKSGSPSGSSSDYSTTADHDNSIQTNAFDPANNGFCFTPHFTNNQTLTGHIYNCPGGVATTNEVSGGSLSGFGNNGAITGPQPNPMSMNVAETGNWNVLATAPSGYHFVGCPNGQTAANTGASPTITNPSSASEATSVPSGGTGSVFFYVAPDTQNLIGHIYLCNGGSQTTTEVSGGTMSATGPKAGDTVGSTSNPLNATVNDPGNWTVSATAPANTQFVACGGATPTSPGSTSQVVNVPSNGTGTAIFYVSSNSPVLSITKSASVANNGTITAGTSFTYTLVATDNGPGDANNAVVSDTIPTGLSINGTPSSTQGSCTVAGQTVTCNLGTLHQGAAASVTINANVTANGTVCGPVSNTGQVSASNAATATSNTWVVNVNCPNFSINLTKSASVGNNATIAAGTNFSYTLVATNSGGAAATGVVVTDAIPSQLGISGTPTSTQGTCSTSANNVTCNIGTLAANGGSATITINVTTSTASCGTVNNMGQVTATGGTVGNSNTVTTTITCPTNPSISVGVVKTNNAQDPTGTNFGKTETAQSLGESFSYQAVITNTSTVTEVIGTVTDDIPGQPTEDICSSLVGTPLAAGASVTCTFPGLAPSTSGASQTDTVTVPVSQQGTPTNTATGTDTSTVNTPPAVVITKANNAAGTGYGTSETAAAGATTVPYQVVVTNPNSAPGTITALTDTIGTTVTNICPELINTVLQPGASVTCNFTTAVPSSVTTDTAGVTLSVNGTLVSGTAQSTVFPPVLGTVITPATPTTPTPATLAFTGPTAPVGKMLAWALGMIALGLMFLAGLQLVDERRRPKLRFALVGRSRTTPSAGADGHTAGPAKRANRANADGSGTYGTGGPASGAAVPGLIQQTPAAAALSWCGRRFRGGGR